ncbi:hypothetical protein LguiA_033196 [Lonicera macranthoides]
MRSVCDRLFKRDLPPNLNQAIMVAHGVKRINVLVQELNLLKLRHEAKKERGKRLHEMLAAHTEKALENSGKNAMSKKDLIKRVKTSVTTIKDLSEQIADVHKVERKIYQMNNKYQSRGRRSPK